MYSDVVQPQTDLHENVWEKDEFYVFSLETNVISKQMHLITFGREFCKTKFTRSRAK